MVIAYTVLGVTEDKEFSYNMHKLNNKTYDYQLNMPFMVNDDMLIESPSAKPYDIPLPVGIKKCNVSVIMVNVKSVTIRSENFLVPLRRTIKVPEDSEPTMGIIEIPSNGLYNVTNAVISMPSGETNALIATGTYINEYSGELKFPIKYGKSPKSLFSVDGGGNTIKAKLISAHNPLPTTLFGIILSDIEYGGVPSPDY